jgi:hypothetical protein
MSMEDERTSREQLLEQLLQTQSDLQSRDQTLAQLQTQKSSLESTLTESQRRAQELAQQASAASQDASLTKERLAQIQKELEAKRSETERQQLSLAELARQKTILEQQKLAVEQQKALVEQQKNAVERQFENLNTAVKVAEVEKKILYESLTDQLQRELDLHRTEAEKKSDALTQLEQQRAAAQEQIASLNTAVKVVEAEKKLLTDSLIDLKQEVTVVRSEKANILQKTEVLAGSVAQLAEKSGELTGTVTQLAEKSTELTGSVSQLAEKSVQLTQEIRTNRPINANTLFSDFLTNRIDVSVSAVRPGLFGPVNRSKEASTVLVSDGGKTYALIHVQDTPFSLGEVGVNWENMAGRISRPPHSFNFSLMAFLAADPRLIAVPVAQEHVQSLGTKVYPTAADPFKFEEAVLMSKGGKYYGETEFKIDPKAPQYVKMKTKFFSRLFGEFSPSAGDLVFSKTGELLGVMANNEYCAVVKNFFPTTTLSMGSQSSGGTGQKLEEMYFRLVRLPYRLQ